MLPKRIVSGKRSRKERSRKVQKKKKKKHSSLGCLIFSVIFQENFNACVCMLYVQLQTVSYNVPLRKGACLSQCGKRQMQQNLLLLLMFPSLLPMCADPSSASYVMYSKNDLPACVSIVPRCQSDSTCLNEEGWPRSSFPERISQYLTDITRMR